VEARAARAGTENPEGEPNPTRASDASLAEMPVRTNRTRTVEQSLEAQPMLGANRVVKLRGICRELGTATGRESADGEEQEGSSWIERFNSHVSWRKL